MMDGAEITDMKVLSYSLCAWPTHEDGTPYTEDEAKAHGVYMVRVGERTFGGYLVEEDDA